MCNRLKTAVKVRGSVFEIDEHATESDIQRAEPFFFQRTNGRKRETFEMYRGCVITSYTRTIVNKPERVHVPYLFGYSVDDEQAYTLCMTQDCRTLARARSEIDRMLECGMLYRADYNGE